MRGSRRLITSSDVDRKDLPGQAAPHRCDQPGLRHNGAGCAVVEIQRQQFAGPVVDVTQLGRLRRRRSVIRHLTTDQPVQAIIGVFNGRQQLGRAMVTGGPAGSGWVAKRQDAAPSASDKSSTVVRTVTFVLCPLAPNRFRSGHPATGRCTLRVGQFFNDRSHSGIRLVPSAPDRFRSGYPVSR